MKIGLHKAKGETMNAQDKLIEQDEKDLSEYFGLAAGYFIAELIGAITTYLIMSMRCG